MANELQYLAPGCQARRHGPTHAHQREKQWPSGATLVTLSIALCAALVAVDDERGGCGLLDHHYAAASSRKAGPTLPAPPYIAHRQTAFNSETQNTEAVRDWYSKERARREALPAGVAEPMPMLSSFNTKIGREHINSHDAFWRAGWQPVPMHSVDRILAATPARTPSGGAEGGGNTGKNNLDAERVPFQAGGLDYVPGPVPRELLPPSSSSASSALPSSFINLTSYSYEAPRGHKIFTLISPHVDVIKRRAEVTPAALYGPASTQLIAAGDNSQEAAALAKRLEQWTGMCSAQTDSDWCFITIGCWGSGNTKTQFKVSRAMEIVLNKFAGRDLFPNRAATVKSVNADGSPVTLSDYERIANLDRDLTLPQYTIRPCDVRFGTINGDNFYQAGITRADTPRLVSGFELIYPSPTLLAMPWLVSLGNHDYRGDWFQQTLLTNRPVVESWGKVGNAGPIDNEIGDWVREMKASKDGVDGTPLTNGYLRPLRAVDVADPQTFSTGRWYLPHPYYSTRPSQELAFITLDCPLLERCQNNGAEHPRCWDRGQQKGWLASLLETLDADPLLKYRVIQCHYPMYANGPHVNHQWLVDFIEPLMVKHGVQLYINADNHYLQVSKKTTPPGGFGSSRGGGGSDDGSSAGVDYYFLNSGGGGGYGLNHHRTDKNYAKNPFSVFDEIRNGPFFHCLRDVGKPSERLVTMVYNDDGEKLFEFAVKPFVSPSAIKARGNVKSDADGSPAITREAVNVDDDLEGAPATLSRKKGGSRTDEASGILNTRKNGGAVAGTHAGINEVTAFDHLIHLFIGFFCFLVLFGFWTLRRRPATYSGVRRGGAPANAFPSSSPNQGNGNANFANIWNKRA